MEGLATRGDHVALVQRLAEHLAARGEPRGSPAQTLPRAIETFSDAKLAAVCAAQGLQGLKSREDRLEALEDLQLSGGDARKAIRGRANTLAISDVKTAGKGNAKAPAIENAKATKKAKPGVRATRVLVPRRSAAQHRGSCMRSHRDYDS